MGCRAMLGNPFCFSKFPFALYHKIQKYSTLFHVNYDILQRTGRRYCICTGMLFDPHEPLSLEMAERELAKDPNIKI